MEGFGVHVTAIVHCPVCRQTLELDREFLGREVECGACQRPFIAGTHQAPRDDEPEIIYTTPIDDDFRRDQRPLTAADASTLGWGICSLIIGLLGILLLPITLCCSLGILGSVVSGLGMLCGLAGLFTRSTASRGLAIAGVVLNAILCIFCTAMFFYFTTKR